MEANLCADEVENGPKDELEELVETLEQHTNWDGQRLFKYQGFWYPRIFVRAALSAGKHLKADKRDIILATKPKAGTTWLKGLAFCIANRQLYSMDQNPLLTCNPHKLVPFWDLDISLGRQNLDVPPLSGPRILSTHLPLAALPDNILASHCRIIYLCRNTLDTFISGHFFFTENRVEKDGKPVELAESFDMFCRGDHILGPFWDHMLGYWNAHLTHPHKVLFLKYEDLREDTAFYVKQIAEFMGQPFSPEEEKGGVIDQILSLCSFETLRNLEVNKTGIDDAAGVEIKNHTFFRKGMVGDWKNHLTPEMGERMKKVMETKLGASGLTFNI